nr:unnamed protein product [Callosobruchus analis]
MSVTHMAIINSVQQDHEIKTVTDQPWDMSDEFLQQSLAKSIIPQSKNFTTTMPYSCTGYGERGYLTPLFKTSKTRKLEAGDLYKTLENFDSSGLGSKLEKLWEDEVAKAKKKKPSLARCLYKIVGLEYTGWGLMFFVYTILTLILMIVILASSIFHHHSTFGMLRCSIRVRAAISTLVYRKILKLNQNVLGRSTSAGQIINLLSNDLSRIDTMAIMLHVFWILPIQIVITCCLIWRQVGISALAGILAMAVFSIPVQGYLSKLMGKLRLKVAEKTDKRVKLMTEIVSGIQVIKMYTWEKPFEKLIHFIRKSEVKDLTKSSYIHAFNVCIPGHGLSADKVFSMAQLFNILQVSAAVQYPLAVSYTSQSWVSIKRLQSFLALEEKEQPNIEECEEGAVSLNNISAAWVKGIPVLKKITLNLKPGTLCAIIGPVILGELPLSDGVAKVGEGISYASQKPWLFSATVRQNILFGQDYDRKLYKKVVKVCALSKDFEQFPYGDHTVVGDKGASLSGGQKARINLARAIYRKASIYLLDDPLSAVDAAVGKLLFNDCIYRYLKGKLRILVTHQLQYLMKADVVVVVNKGEIEAMGTYSELSSNNLDFSKLLRHQESDNEDDKEVTEQGGTLMSIYSTTSEIQSLHNSDEIEAETEYHRIKSPLKQYIKACENNCLILALFLVLIISQSLCSGADYWEEIRHSSAASPLDSPKSNDGTLFIDNIHPGDLPRYTYNVTDEMSNMSQHLHPSDIYDEFLYKNQTYYLFKTDIAISMYGLLILLIILFTIARSLMFFKMCMLSSINLHRRMFTALLNAPMRFFSINPSGRILNRFSKDMGAVDELLTTCLVILVMVGVIVNVCNANPYATIAVIVLGCAIIKIYSTFITTAKGLKHLEGTTKSPVFTHVSSTISGLVTIRTCQIENTLIQQFEDHQDVNTSAWWMIGALQAGLGIWIDAICVLFIACISFTFIIVQSASKQTSGSMVGLALSQAFILTGMLQYGLKQICDVIGHLTSVERVLQYTLVEPEEQPQVPKDVIPWKSWPNRGVIEFRNLYLRYDLSEPAVLKGLNFSIHEAEKIGVVGRTGAGKSSLIAAIFRLAPLEGTICIDGVDTGRISLSGLRKRISIIPQEPVELKVAFPSLDFMVTEGGGNFSTGERQLVCLARAILRNNRILIMDEATANVDQRTDSFIQDTIRRRFSNCTVITIAHRLNTIMDYDRILVMGSGNMLEFDHAHRLLQIPDGHFHGMVLETGQQMATELKNQAEQAYRRKYME